MSLNHEEQLVLIKLYLFDRLSKSDKKHVERLLETDTGFQQLYFTYLLVHNNIYDRQLDADLETEVLKYSSEILSQAVDSTKREGGYVVGKNFKRLFLMLLPKGVAAIVALAILTAVVYILRPANRTVLQIPVESYEQGLSGERDIPLVVYSKDSRWLRRGDSYKWPADSLRIYSRRLFNDPYKHQWTLEPTQEPNEFLLTTHDGVYTIYKKQEELTPLTINE
jgi:hypothetical protein